MCLSHLWEATCSRRVQDGFFTPQYLQEREEVLAMEDSLEKEDEEQEEEEGNTLNLHNISFGLELLS